MTDRSAASRKAAVTRKANIAAERDRIDKLYPVLEHWPADKVRVILDFDDDGVAVTRKEKRGAQPTTERVDLNATENGGTLTVRTRGQKIGYVFVVQKWEKTS